MFCPDILDEIVDILVPDIVAEYEKSFVNTSRIGERLDELAEIFDSVVDLNCYHDSVIGYRTKQIFIVDVLQEIIVCTTMKNYS